MAVNPPGKVTFNDFQYVAAYAILIMILMLVARTRVGYVTVYYLLCLFLFTLILLNSNKIISLLSPISSGG